MPERYLDPSFSRIQESMSCRLTVRMWYIAVGVNHSITGSLEDNLSSTRASSFKIDHSSDCILCLLVLCNVEMGGVLQTLFASVEEEHCSMVQGCRRACHDSKCFDLNVALAPRQETARETLTMTETPARSSAAPGDGKVESRCAFTRMASFLESGTVLEESRTTMLVNWRALCSGSDCEVCNGQGRQPRFRTWKYCFHTCLPIKSNR